MNVKRLTLTVEGELGESSKRITLDVPFDYALALRPLPRDREIDGYASRAAQLQRDLRVKAIKDIGQALSRALADIVNTADPVDGYSRAEINDMYGHPPYDPDATVEVTLGRL